MSDKIPKFPKFGLPFTVDEATVINRYEEWRAKTVETLEKLLEKAPIYPDDVGGMYPYEIQMYSADVDKFVEKVKAFLESLKR